MEDPAQMQKLQVYKEKVKTGTIDRVVDDYSVIGKGMFKKEFDMNTLKGFTVTKSNGEEGKVEASFGKSGKFKMVFKTSQQESKEGSNVLTMKFKKYVFHPSQTLLQ